MSTLTAIPMSNVHNRNTRECTVCVMTDAQAPLEFDAKGQCECCRDAIARRPHEWWPGAEGETRLERLAERLRAEGRSQPYDVMIGLSGGVDSAYLAHLMHSRFGLRMLAVHVDGGWNSAPATRNIAAMVRGLDLDLYTKVIEWREMRDVQLAFLRSGVLNQDFPQDHAFFATLYACAAKFGIRSFLSGVNFASECVGVPGLDAPPSIDGKHVRAIHRQFGTVALQDYPIMSFAEYLWATRVRGRPVVDRPLNYVAYDKAAAQEELRGIYGWRDYGAKHSESRFTKFYQDIFLVRKFGFDKRRLHLSSLIVSGQETRESAHEELAVPPVGEREAERDINYVAKKLGIMPAELNDLIDAPPVPHSAYPSDQAAHRFLHAARRKLRNARRIKA